MKTNMASEIAKLREGHIGYILLSDEEIKQEIKERISLSVPIDLLVFGPDEWKRYFSVELTKEQLKRLPKFPWGKRVLESPCPLNPDKKVKETHIAFLGLDQINGKKINIWRLKNNKLLPNIKIYSRSRGICLAPSYNSPRYMMKPLELRWYLMPISLPQVNDSRTLTVAIKSIPEGYRIASVIEEMFKAALLFFATSQTSNTAIVSEKVEDDNLTVESRSDGRFVIAKIGGRSYEWSRYGNYLGRTKKNTDIPVAICRN